MREGIGFLGWGVDVCGFLCVFVCDFGDVDEEEVEEEVDDEVHLEAWRKSVLVGVRGVDGSKANGDLVGWE